MTSAFDVESVGVVNTTEVNELTEARSQSSSAWGRTLFRGGKAGLGDKGGTTTIRSQRNLLQS